MKIHNDFTLYWRVLASGKRVVYYYAYDENNIRLPGRSTGETNMTAARTVCNRLLKDGLLVPNKKIVPTFGEYARGWWEWDTCEYLKKRHKRKNITRSYADNNKKMLHNRLLPYFKDMPLNKITPETIEVFIGEQGKAGYKNTYINTFLGTLKTMLLEAVARKIITENPMARIEKLVNDRKAIKIITQEELPPGIGADRDKPCGGAEPGAIAPRLAAFPEHGITGCGGSGIEGAIGNGAQV